MTGLKSPRWRTGVVCDITHLCPFPNQEQMRMMMTQMIETDNNIEHKKSHIYDINEQYYKKNI